MEQGVGKDLLYARMWMNFINIIKSEESQIFFHSIRCYRKPEWTFWLSQYTKLKKKFILKF